MKNFWFLFSAFLMVWIGICVYLVRLSILQRRIVERLDEIRRRLGTDSGR